MTDREKDKDPSKKKAADGESGEEDETANLSREERKKKYLERADVLEAVNVAADLAVELKTPSIQLGSKVKAPNEVQPTEPAKDASGVN